MKNRYLLTLLSIGFLLVFSKAELTAQYKIERSSIINGASVANGGTHKIRSSVGESMIGISANASYKSFFGFLYTQQPIITDVKSVNSLIPEIFEMQQNYPNPFNPSTVIEFAVPQESKVLLEVFNILGEKLVTLVNEVKTPGYYKVNFDAGLLSSGFYIYRIQADKFIEVKKMILLK
ncbi:MAG: T9SS type A sorting domain-containing protein [Ignavibacteriae bacterium]|nr:T9SS type A sorting domain-containing protein [Ignavibacteriota bacterium]